MVYHVIRIRVFSRSRTWWSRHSAAPSRSVGNLPSVAALSNPNIRASNPGTQVNMSVNVGIMCRPGLAGTRITTRRVTCFLCTLALIVSGSLRRVANLPVLNMMSKRDESNVSTRRRSSATMITGSFRCPRVCHGPGQPATPLWSHRAGPCLRHQLLKQSTTPR